MSKYNLQQCLADILSNIEKARLYLSNMTQDEFCSNDQIVDAVLRRLENASEAYARLWNKERGYPEIAREIEARHPGVPWRRFQSLANRFRHDYDLIQEDIIWKILEPAGTATQVEQAIREELPFSQISPTD